MLIIRCNWHSSTISRTEISHKKKIPVWSHLTTMYVKNIFTISCYKKKYVHVSEPHLWKKQNKFCKSFITFLGTCHIRCNLQRSICTNILHKFVPLLFHESVIKLLLRKLVQCNNLCKNVLMNSLHESHLLWFLMHIYETWSNQSKPSKESLSMQQFTQSFLETIYRNSVCLCFGKPFMKLKKNKFSKSTNCMQTVTFNAII